MPRVNSSTLRSRALCLPVDKLSFEFTGSGFVEAIFMLLLDDTRSIHTLAFWDTSYRAK
jgi:hypothetical protein